MQTFNIWPSVIYHWTKAKKRVFWSNTTPLCRSILDFDTTLNQSVVKRFVEYMLGSQNSNSRAPNGAVVRRIRYFVNPTKCISTKYVLSTLYFINGENVFFSCSAALNTRIWERTIEHLDVEGLSCSLTYTYLQLSTFISWCQYF